MLGVALLDCSSQKDGKGGRSCGACLKPWGLSISSINLGLQALSHILNSSLETRGAGSGLGKPFHQLICRPFIGPLGPCLIHQRQVTVHRQVFASAHGPSLGTGAYLLEALNFSPRQIAQEAFTDFHAPRIMKLRRQAQQPKATVNPNPTLGRLRPPYASRTRKIPCTS